MPAVRRVFVLVLGNTMNSHRLFMDRLKTKVELHEDSTDNDCDVIIAFVPIVSRAGTDIQAAVERIPKNKPVILVVLHHTFDVYSTPPDSKLCINRDRMFAVDCLFYEDQGLLRCQRNDRAITEVMEYMNRKEHSEVDVNYSRWKFPISGGLPGLLVALVSGAYLCGYLHGHWRGCWDGYKYGFWSSYWFGYGFWGRNWSIYLGDF